MRSSTVFNEKLRGKLESASWALELTPPAVEKAKKELQEGEELCFSRQKLIRIADRSEYGWITVNEYEDDELASNSNDEKRIYRAELRAAKKVKSAGQKAANKKKFNRGWKSFGGMATHTSQHLHRQFSASLQSGGAVLPHGVASSSLPVGARQVVGPCFQCGKEGHFRRSCPLLCATYSAAK